MECLGGDVNRMVCGMGWSGGWGWERRCRLGVKMLSLGLGLVGLSLGLGDCVWCVLLPEPVANATFSSHSMPPVSHN